jgi:hypothetical protein
LENLHLPRREIQVAKLEWSGYLDYLEALGVQAGLLSGVDSSAFHVLARDRDPGPPPSRCDRAGLLNRDPSGRPRWPRGVYASVGFRDLGRFIEDAPER